MLPHALNMALGVLAARKTSRIWATQNTIPVPKLSRHTTGHSSQLNETERLRGGAAENHGQFRTQARQPWRTERGIGRGDSSGLLVLNIMCTCTRPTFDVAFRAGYAEVVDREAADNKSTTPRQHPHSHAMSKASLQTMETIHESTHKTLEIPGLLPEAALFSVAKPTRPRTEAVVMSGAVNDGLFGRSSSMKMPLTRKASFRVREWVKRSSSTR